MRLGQIRRALPRKPPRELPGSRPEAFAQRRVLEDGPHGWEPGFAGDIGFVATTPDTAFGPHSQVRTAVGQGLFDFGHRDGPADAALLQHPLGVAVLPDGSVAIADTYNGAVRRYVPPAPAAASGAVGEGTTLARDLAEPSGLLVATARCRRCRR